MKQDSGNKTGAAFVSLSAALMATAPATGSGTERVGQGAPPGAAHLFTSASP